MSYSEISLLHGIHSQVCVFSHEPKKKEKNSVNKNQYQIKAWWESLGTKLPSLANT